VIKFAGRGSLMLQDHSTETCELVSTTRHNDPEANQHRITGCRTPDRRKRRADNFLLQTTCCQWPYVIIHVLDVLGFTIHW
jgi:hypothetical protein